MTFLKISRIAAAALIVMSMGGTAAAQSSAIQDGYDPVIEWCNNSLNTLYRYEEQAKAEYYASLHQPERIKMAKRILLDGLRVASRLSPAWGHGRSGPITARAIKRVLLIGETVNVAVGPSRPSPVVGPSVPAGDFSVEFPEANFAVERGLPRADQGNLGDRTAVLLLFEGYKFIRNVAERLDIPYYIPYSYDPYYPSCRGGCGVDMVELERAFVEMASDQIAFVQNALSESGAPLGLPKAYLKALETVTAASAYDLRNSFWATQFACEIDQLESLASRMKGFNDRNERHIYPTEQEAFYRTTAEATYLVEMIRAGESCVGYRHERPAPRRHRRR